MANNRDRITFQQLRDGQPGIVCNEKIDAAERWGLDTAKENLIGRVDDIIRRIDQTEQVTGYYFGKTFVDEDLEQNFDRTDPDTWDFHDVEERRRGISEHWRLRGQENHRGLIVLTVIDENVNPHQNPAYTYEEFALALKLELIIHYKIRMNDNRIRSNFFIEGGRALNEHPGYVVYMAVTITDKEDKEDEEKEEDKEDEEKEEDKEDEEEEDKEDEEKEEDKEDEEEEDKEDEEKEEDKEDEEKEEDKEDEEKEEDKEENEDKDNKEDNEDRKKEGQNPLQ